MNKFILFAILSSIMPITKAIAFSGYYEIVNRNSGMVVEVPGASTNNNVNLDQWIANSGANQQWTLTDLGTGYYKIINKNSGLALEGKGWGTNSGVIVDQWAYNGGNNQQWAVSSLGNGCYKLINRNNSLALDLAGLNLYDGGGVDEWAYGGGNNQQWLILPVTVTGTVSPSSGGSGVAADTFQGFNWADPDDNFQDGPILPTGLNITDSYSTVQTTAGIVLGDFQSYGANTVRMPINPETVIGTWWLSYKGAIDKATSLGMKVIICDWDGASVKDGSVDSMVLFWQMWDTVVTAYNENSNVYFELFNEPWAYDDTDWLNLTSGWLARYPTVAHGRVLVGGTGADTDVPAVASSGITSGCLFSVHDYGTYSPTKVTDAYWYNHLSGEVGSYASRIVLTEFGAPMTSGHNYLGGDQGNNDIASMIGFTDYCYYNQMGSLLWYGARLNDGYGYSYSMFTFNNNAMSLNNSSAMSLIQFGWSY